MHLNKVYQNALIPLASDTLDDRSGYMETVISGTGYADFVRVLG